MLSIGEAWEPFGSLNRRMGKANAQASARVLALAVLDVTHCGNSAYHEALQGCNCTTWAEGDRCRAYKALRAQIEALGKEGASS